MPLPFFSKQRQQTKKRGQISLSFLENGSSLLEELVSCFGAKYKNPIRNFTAKELITATNNFTGRIVMGGNLCMYRGFIKEQEVLVKRLNREDPSTHIFRGPLRDIAVSSQMGHLKNVLKLKGCCLEFEFPALVFESAGTELLADLLHHPDNEKKLSWNQRLEVAKGIAYAIAYMHTEFPNPIIYRDLHPSQVFIDKDGIPKISDFSYSISFPPGESKVADVVVGSWGYIDPEYLESSIVTEKTDVYSFGVLLLVLLTGNKIMCKNHRNERIDVVDYVKYHVDNNQMNRIFDSSFWEDEKAEHRKQMSDFLNLALKCTHKRGNDRPDMVQVAKELCKIQKCA